MHFLLDSKGGHEVYQGKCLWQKRACAEDHCKELHK